MAEDKKELAPELKEKLRAEFEQDWRKDLRKSVPVKERTKVLRQKTREDDVKATNTLVKQGTTLVDRTVSNSCG